MHSSSSFVIREATVKDSHAIQQLAAMAGSRPLEGDILVGEIAGRPAAAISLKDERVVADAFGIFLGLAAQLRMRAREIGAAKYSSLLRQRIMVGVGGGAAAAAANAAWN